MNRRICACGAAIVCADLDGHPVWIDEQPGDGGMLTIREHGNHLDAVCDGGPYRRHTCGADPLIDRLRQQVDAHTGATP